MDWFVPLKDRTGSFGARSMTDPILLKVVSNVFRHSASKAALSVDGASAKSSS